MDAFALLQIIIALIFIYFIVSLVVSELQEQLAAVIQWRARNLKKAIEIFAGEKFTEELYQSKSLFSGFNQYTNQKIPGKSIGPSYIQKEIFAESLMSIIQAKINAKAQDTQESTLSSKQLLFPEDQTSHITEILGKLSSQYPELIERLKEVAYIAKLKHDEPTIEDFTAEIANTFNQVMERTSGVYKRNAKGVSLLLGFVVASLFNIDTFHIVDKLYADPDLRQGFDDLATEMVKTNDNCLEAADNNEVKKEECLTNLETKTEEIKASLAKSHPLPIGWSENGWFNGEVIADQGGFLQAGLGWFISAIAISMGAPFWFDLLGKIVNVRNTVRPYESKKDASEK